MKSDDKNNKVTGPVLSAEDRRVAARRRILKGAVAAPVIYTLHSGTALASRSISCADEPEKTMPLFRAGQSNNYRVGSPSGPMVQLRYVGDEYADGSTTYRFDGTQLITGSCWTSLTVAMTSKASTGHFV